jgi:hypothetical protein
LFRVKVVTNVILSSKLGEIPEIKEDCQEILDAIKSYKPLDSPLICITLFSIMLTFATISAVYYNLGGLLWESNPHFSSLFFELSQRVWDIYEYYENLYVEFDCDIIQPPQDEMIGDRFLLFNLLPQRLSFSL